MSMEIDGRILSRFHHVRGGHQRRLRAIVYDTRRWRFGGQTTARPNFRCPCRTQFAGFDRGRSTSATTAGLCVSGCA